MEKYTIIDDAVKRFGFTREEKKNLQMDEFGHGTVTWDPNRADYAKSPLRCKHPDCKNWPMWRCDPKTMFIRNEQYDRVWEGCRGLVCEAHVVKLFDKTDDNIVNTFWNQQEYFYDYERYVLEKAGPKREELDIPKQKIYTCPNPIYCCFQYGLCCSCTRFYKDEPAPDGWTCRLANCCEVKCCEGSECCTPGSCCKPSGPCCQPSEPCCQCGPSKPCCESKPSKPCCESKESEPCCPEGFPFCCYKQKVEEDPDPVVEDAGDGLMRPVQKLAYKYLAKAAFMKDYADYVKKRLT